MLIQLYFSYLLFLLCYPLCFCVEILGCPGFWDQVVKDWGLHDAPLHIYIGQYLIASIGEMSDYDHMVFAGEGTGCGDG